jgi:tRNA 2-thiouridine synthesizing protein E
MNKDALTHSIVHQGRVIPVDEEGFLLDTSDWSLELAAQIAADIRIDMTQDHWDLVMFVRNYFESCGAVPELRHVLKHRRETHGADAATRRHVYKLFPYGYGQQACKIAGMRKPRKLMLDV